MTVQPGLPDRRPLASRNTRWANAFAGALARWAVSPNAISTVGMIAGLTAAGLLAATAVTGGWPQRICWLAAAGCVQLRLLANLLDGMVAVASHRTSRLGELFNELPDRVSDAAILIGLGYAAGGTAELGYLAAVAALFTAYVRVVGKSVGVPGVYAGPMAKQHRMAAVTATAILCAVIPVDWVERYRLPAWAAGVIFVGTLVTAGRRVIIIAGNLPTVRP